MGYIFIGRPYACLFNAWTKPVSAGFCIQNAPKTVKNEPPAAFGLSCQLRCPTCAMAPVGDTGKFQNCSKSAPQPGGAWPQLGGGCPWASPGLLRSDPVDVLWRQSNKTHAFQSARRSDSCEPGPPKTLRNHQIPSPLGPRACARVLGAVGSKVCYRANQKCIFRGHHADPTRGDFYAGGPSKLPAEVPNMRHGPRPGTPQIPQMLENCTPAGGDPWGVHG
eukprot:gene9753-biopygen12255